MKKIVLIIFAVNLLLACSSSELIESWKNPEIESFGANKVLIIGMAQDESIRKVFETQLKTLLAENNINSERSLDVFSNAFTTSLQNQEQLKALENELMDQGFDAIVISKLIGLEDATSWMDAYESTDNFFENFRDDYFSNQGIYSRGTNLVTYEVYHAETDLYCLCSSMERELVWKAYVDIMEPERIRKGLKDYVQVLVTTWEEQQLLIGQKP